MNLFKKSAFVAATLLSLGAFAGPPIDDGGPVEDPDGGGSSGGSSSCYDCIAHNISTQDSCTEVTRGATYDYRWHQGLSVNVDQDVLNGEIAAYKIKWSSGWSNWYVPGVNDIDTKVNKGNSATDNTMRRVWSYFYDHQHTFIVCN